MKVLIVFLFLAAAMNAFGQKIPAELTGTWQTGNVSMLQEKNLNTGQVSTSNGSTFTYKFYADGKFEFIGFMRSTMFGCATDLFNDKRGKIKIDGDQMTLVPSKNFWRNTYSCSPRSNKEKDHVLENETFSWRIEEDEYGKEFVCLANEKGETCYRKE